ncbi:MAG: CotH kinase family protein [Anaerolineae bacterium]
MRISRDSSTDTDIHVPSARHRPFLRTVGPAVLTLGVLTIGLVALVLQVMGVPTAAGELNLSTPLPPTATAVPPATPTPTSPELGDGLETLYIDIAGRELAQIEAKREEALEHWILLTTDDDYVPATLRYGGETIPVEMRLKGDWADHVAFDKWSFRFETESETMFEGMQAFSIQDPSMRVYLNEYLFLEALRTEDVLGVRYDFVHVVLNGEYKGIYAVEEAFAKELIESRERREGVIIRYDEDLLWTARFHYDDQTIPSALERFYLIDEFESARVNESPVLSAERDAAVGLLRGFLAGDLTAPEVFDLEAMGTFLAAVDLWSAPHALIWHNLRFYYDPVSARLEPVAFDCDPFSPELDFEKVGLSFDDFHGDPYLQAAYARALARMSRPGYVEALEAQLGPDYERFRAALEPEFGAEVLAAPWDLLRRRQELIRQRLAPIQTTYAYRVRTGAGGDGGGDSGWLTVDVGNLLDLPVEVLGLRVDGADVPATLDWVDEASTSLTVPPLSDDAEALILRALPPQAAVLPYVRLNVPLTVTFGSEVELLTHVWGLTETLTQTVLSSYPLPLTASPRPAAPTLEEALQRHPYLATTEDASIVTIPPGTWEISGSLVLPAGYGLRLDPGTTLRFGADDFLLASGPLLFQGTAEAPVVLQPKDGEVWLGVAVLDADDASLWHYVTVENTDAIDVDGWTFTGGVTFHRSPVRISYSRFLGTRAEDGLNIIRASFEIADTEFADTASDAFDGDFTEGSFHRCVFHDILADGIDVSGSEVTVMDARFHNLGDKALSVGEGSQVTVDGILVDSADFGLVSKDRSGLTASNVTLQNIRLAGLAAYIKKPAYGPATLSAVGVDFGNVPPEKQTLVQTRCYIDLEGERRWGTEVDVDALYEKW